MFHQALTRRSFLQAAAVTAAGTLVAACTPAATPEVKEVEKIVQQTVVVKETQVVKVVEEVQKVVTATPGPAAPVTIYFPQAMGDDGQPVFEGIAKRFQQKHPNVTVKVDPTFDWDSQKYLVQAAAGTAPDIIWGDEDWSFLLSSKGVLLDLNPFMDASGFKRDNYADILDKFSWQGKLFSFPIWIGAEGVFFNLDLLDKAGLELPPDNWTYEDMRTMAKQLTIDENKDGDPEQYGIHIQTGWDNPWGSTVMAYGGKFYSADGTDFVLCQKPNYDGLQYLIDLIHKDKVAPTPEITEALAGGGDPFQTGVCAMTISNPWGFARYRRGATFTWDCAPMPLGPTGGKGASLSSDSLSIYRGSKNPDVAWQFTDELLSFESQKAYCTEFKGPQPVHKEAFQYWLRPEDPPKHQQLFIDALEYAECPMWSMFSYIVQDPFYMALGDVTSGNKSLEEAMDEVCQPIKEAIQAEIEKLASYSGS